MAALFVWAVTASAGEIVVKVPADEYQATKDQLKEMRATIEKLQKEVAEMKGEVGQVSSRKIRKMDRDISDIYDTLDEVETKTIKDRVNFGAELRIRMDNYRVRDFDQPGMSMFYDDGEWHTTPTATDERNDANWSSRMRLNMDAEVSRSVKFHGRLALYKNWADSTPGYSDDTNRAHRATGDTNLKVDRFYVDWIPEHFFVPLAITIGRQPTTDGPPYEFKDNRERQSTYPSLVFDGEPDGIVATIGLERWTGLKNSGLRYFYAMAYQFDDDGDNGGSVLDAAYKDGLKDTRVHGLFFETQIPGLPDSLLVADYIMAKDFAVIPPDGAIEDGANIGDMNLWGLHAQVRDIAGTGLDLFASYAENRSDPNGNTVKIGADDKGGGDVTAGAAPGGPFFMGLLGTGSNIGKHTGRAYYAGLRYTIPVRFLNRPKIGFEYNKGSQYWFSFTPGSTEVTNKLATRGEAFEYYYIQPFNKYMHLRLGLLQIEYDYAGSGSPLGMPVDYSAAYGKSPKLDNFYVLLDTRF
jgi:hypothetical protein